MGDIFKKLASFFLEFIETIVIALAVFVIVYLFLFQPHQVRGNSMYPNFYDGEYMLTDKISYRFKLPQKGDVIVFKAPRNEDYDYIKRIIAGPGDNVRIENDKIFINNQPADVSYIPADYITTPGVFMKNGQNLVVPSDQYFVLGDNRSHSSDSREWGFVPKENIIGKAWLRYWPPSRWGLIPQTQP